MALESVILRRGSPLRISVVSVGRKSPITGEDFLLDRDPVSMEFVTPDGQVTNAGLLLCDQGPLRQSRIFCTRWKGAKKGSVDADALDDQEYSGSSIITLLQNAEAFIRNNSKTPWTVRGMTREERSDFPRRAVREVLVNAIIHRDYQMVGSEIHVDIFDDRLEIMSPGGMVSGKRIQDLDLQHIPSMRRNQIISDLFVIWIGGVVESSASSPPTMKSVRSPLSILIQIASL